MAGEGATSALLVVLAGRQLRVGPGGFGLLLASLVVGGVAADALGIRAVYYLGGVLLLVAGAVGFAGLPPQSEQHRDGRVVDR